MANLENLTRCLVAAGGISLPEEGTFFLYVESSTLISKEWTGKSFGDQEFIASSILPSSVATYLVTSTSRIVICISANSTLRAVVYDEDDGQWADDQSLPHYELHPKAQVSGIISEDEGRHVFFQDTSKRLIHLNDAWAPTFLPVNAMEGSPLSTTIVDGQVQLLYISAGDTQIHQATQQKDGSWNDAVFSKYAFDESEKPERFVTSQDDDGRPVVFALTQGKILLQIPVDGERSELGTVDVAGNWVPMSKEEAVPNIPFRYGRVVIRF